MLARIILAFAVLISTTAWAKDVELSWEKADVYVPDRWFPRSTAVELDKKYPVVVYLHGCTGPWPQHDNFWAEDFKALGYVTIQLNSFARPNRIANCDPKRSRGNSQFPQAYEYRQQEIDYAMSQLRKLPWVDQDRIVLVGFSEGGIAAAQTTQRFRAVVILGWTCTHQWQYSYLDGVKSPKDVPILAVAFTDDVWRKGTLVEGRCATRAPDHMITQIDLPGAGHEVHSSDQGRRAVLEFLKSQLK